MKILVVEDEKDLNNIIAKHLKKGGYSVDCAFNGLEALDFIDVALYDAILLDVMMPQMDGFEFLRRLRARKDHTPTLILTAKDEIEEIVKGLDLGADDYLTKPFDFRELQARIRTLVRRKEGHSNSVIDVENLSLDMSKKEVRVDGEAVELTAKEYEILEVLMLNKGKILSRDQIKEHVWDFDYTGGSNIVDVLIKNIRKKVGDADIIKTKRGLGYAIKD